MYMSIYKKYIPKVIQLQTGGIKVSVRIKVKNRASVRIRVKIRDLV